MDHTIHHDMAASAATMCKMHMLWNWETVDTCIVFRSWHVSSKSTFVVSFLIVALIGVMYEWLREVQRVYDTRIARSLAKGKEPSLIGRDVSPGEEALLLGRNGISKGPGGGITVPFTQRLVRAGLYGLMVFVSFFIMLIFMTYNGYLVGAVVLGAATGHWIFNGEMDVDAVLSGSGVNKGVACH
ncbi:hypothetical protein FRB95_000265 [Tulasnella sp. JGI-2019a]|nr:hypothetical protein FRB95_000265 [Tulasnella sp. JGI-2019a]